MREPLRLASSGKRESVRPEKMYPPVPAREPIEGLSNLASESVGLRKVLTATFNLFFCITGAALTLFVFGYGLQFTFEMAKAGYGFPLFLIPTLAGLGIACFLINGIIYMVCHKKFRHPDDADIRP